MDQLDDTHLRELRAYAQRYLDRGWKLVKLHHRGKQAVEKGWPNLERTPEDLQFGDNLGVRFGPQSGGLVDVDLDYATARALVSRPAFGFDHLVEFGRASLPAGRRGHRLVIVPDAPNRSRPFTIRTKAGTALLSERGLKATVLELRGSNGSQSAFPPSIITGKDGVDDPLVWTADDVPAAIPQMSWAELNHRAGLLAFASVAAAVYPSGDPFEFCLHLFGALTEAGVAEPAATEMVTEVARAAGDATDRPDVGVMAGGTESLASFLDLVGLGGIEHIVRGWLCMERAEPAGSEAQRPGQITADQLRRLLDGLHPCDVPGYFDHLSTVLAAHHATAGAEEACEVVVAWSGRNPLYGPGKRDDHGKLWADVVRSHWRNARLDKPDGYTLGTMIHHLREAGQGALVTEVLGASASAAEVFDNAPVDPEWDSEPASPSASEGDAVADRPDLASQSRPEGEPMDAPKKRRFRRWTVSELLALPMPDWLVEGMIIDTALAVLFGRWKTYKTFCALDIALHIALGMPYHGRAVKRTTVVYVIGEGSKRMFGNRVAAWCKLHGIDPADLNDWFRVVPVRVPLDNDSHDGGIREYIATDPARCGLTVFDTLARNMEGDESSNQDMGRAVRGCDDVREHYGGAVLIVHHTGHQGDHARGASALLGAVDVEIMMSKRPEASDQVAMWIKELRDGKSGAELYFEPEVVPLEFDPPTASVAMRFVGEGERDQQPEKGKGKRAVPKATLDRIKLLIAIRDHEGESQRALAKRLGIAQSTVSDRIAAMREDGWLAVDSMTVTEEGHEYIAVYGENPDAAGQIRT
jgi:hypothetical protein